VVRGTSCPRASRCGALVEPPQRAREAPGTDRAKLVGEAASRFDLSPVEEDFLLSSWLKAGR
jgi:hypothetical protein